MIPSVMIRGVGLQNTFVAAILMTFDLTISQELYMATTYYNDLQKLYVAYFNRPADPGGLVFWEGVVEKANGNTAAVSAEFAKSPEYKDAFAGQTNEQIVDTIYKNIFGHTADATGRAFYANALTEKRITVDLVVKDIAGGAQGTDLTAYNNKVKAAEAFTTALDTDAEKAGYAGAEALKLAKEFIAGVTTDASYAAAVAPANLNEVVADVVHAGTPFVMTAALAALDTAIDAKTAFLVTADGDNDAKTSATEVSIAGKVTTAETNIDALITGDYAGKSEGIKAALLADQVTANTKALGEAEKAYATAVTAADKVEGLSTLIATRAAAVAAEKTAETTQAQAGIALTAAESTFELASGTVVTFDVSGNGTAKYTKDGGASTDLIVLDAKGNLALGTGVTETTFKGVTALLNATVAKETADAAEVAAHTATVAAQFGVDVADLKAGSSDELIAVGQAIKLTGDLADNALPTAAQITAEITALEANVAAGTPDAAKALSDFQGLVTAYTTADDANPLTATVDTTKTAVEGAQKTIETLTKATADLTAAQATATQLAGLNEAIKFAQGTFTANEFNVPVTLGAAAAGTSGNDIFLADAKASTLVNFGVAGDDVLYVGSGYKLNTTGDLTKGVNTDLEVFFEKSGTGTKVYVETTAFGSSASVAEVLTITITGVAPEQLKFDNGIITHV
ncbi:DUF4214 domain-containing protein [Pseudoduganella plicata]|uniref:DUF4214 domain-containing protein n=2 Tax=Pseudoduganella plicata TaxID=321984 RepID=A0ABX5SBL5_9BURK|nr:DUF4214 domain-containing protein [Pseudoduganella plicata]